MNPVHQHTDSRSFRLLGGLVLALFAVYTAWLPIHMATVAHCVLPTNLCASANPPDHDHDHDRHHSHADHAGHDRPGHHQHAGDSHHHHPGHGSSDHHQPSPDEHGDQYTGKGSSLTLAHVLFIGEVFFLVPEESAVSVVARSRETVPQFRRAESPPPLRGPPLA